MERERLVEHLVELLEGESAHLPFDDVIAGWPVEQVGVRPAGAPHSGWEILEHMRIAQWDILEFSRRADHASPPFPEGYWPKSPAPPDPGGWERSIAAFRADLEAMQARVREPGADLFMPFPWGDGQTLLREALLVADHNAYHLGQLALLRRLLGLAPAGG